MGKKETHITIIWYQNHKLFFGLKTTRIEIANNNVTVSIAQLVGIILFYSDILYILFYL